MFFVFYNLQLQIINFRQPVLLSIFHHPAWFSITTASSMVSVSIVHQLALVMVVLLLFFVLCKIIYFLFDAFESLQCLWSIRLVYAIMYIESYSFAPSRLSRSFDAFVRVYDCKSVNALRDACIPRLADVYTVLMDLVNVARWHLC